jgi:phosphatidylglycerol:prolipoprotein diacylglycerol transferase
LSAPFYEGANPMGEALIDTLTTVTANAGSAISYTDLHLSPIVFHVGWFALRWYSLAYRAGILLGGWFLV